MKKILSLVLIAAMALSLVACGSEPAATTAAPAATTAAADQTKAEPAGDTIKIGILYPLTGSSAFVGNAQAAGAEAALVDWNAHYNKAGLKVELVKADSEGSADVGVTQAERLITNEGVVGIVGPYNSGVAASVAPVCVKYKIPFAVTNAVADTILADDNNYVFRTNVGDTLNANIGFEYRSWLNEQLPGGMKTAYIYDSGDWGTGAMQANLDCWKSKNAQWEVVYTEAVDTGVSDFSTIITKIKNSGANFVELALYLDDCILFQRQLKEQNLNILINGSGGLVSVDYIAALGKDADYTLTSACYLSDPSRMTDDMKEIEAWYLENVDGAKAIDEPFANGWIGMYAMLHAVEAAGKGDAQAIADALDKMDIENKDGERMFLFAPSTQRMKFEDQVGVSGEMVHNQNWYATVDFSQIFDGNYTTVYPVDNSPIVVDIPAWKDR